MDITVSHGAAPIHPRSFFPPLTASENTTLHQQFGTADSTEASLPNSAHCNGSNCVRGEHSTARNGTESDSTSRCPRGRERSGPRVVPTNPDPKQTWNQPRGRFRTRKSLPPRAAPRRGRAERHRSPRLAPRRVRARGSSGSHHSQFTPSGRRGAAPGGVHVPNEPVVAQRIERAGEATVPSLRTEPFSAANVV